MKYKSKKLVQYRLLDRQKRYFKRKRKLCQKKLHGNNVFSQKNVVNDYETEDDCLGDSEESDTEDVRENNKAEVTVRRQSLQCAKTRMTLAENQLENNEQGDLVCLTCLKRFSNVQNLR